MHLFISDFVFYANVANYTEKETKILLHVYNDTPTTRYMTQCMRIQTQCSDLILVQKSFVVTNGNFRYARTDRAEIGKSATILCDHLCKHRILAMRRLLTQF